ncbi:MAG: hypothetical protein HZA66_20875 [Rhodopseudomonas palustris]|uniref:Uncharacterized protein n=1 Tax=Rhodopseudomonas palustris TaxID=1076 RepID=A0A933VXC1_RHOPL|nr:hypothetical protein [Rhodopseudomonas palustris]
MPYIALTAVIGILFLQASGAIPPGSVGGPMVIALAVFVGALAVGVHDAWTRKRGVLGWIVNIVVVLAGVFLIAPLGGLVMTMLLGPFVQGSSSLAVAGGAVMAAALAGTMLVTLAGCWGALWVVNKWR